MRDYDEMLGALFETIAPTLVLLILVAVTALISAGWYWWPAWIPRRLPRLRLPRPRLNRRRRTPRHGRPLRPQPGTAAPTPAVAAGAGLADRLAAEGRYAEAIRERLRDTVADLTRAGVIDPDPGTTAAELAAAAGPAVGPAITGATSLFSQIWYGREPAGRPEDDRMRHLTGEVRAALDTGKRR